MYDKYNNNSKGDYTMPELESMIENKLIEQLVYGDSQWTYRKDLKTEADYGRISDISLSRITRTG